MMANKRLQSGLPIGLPARERSGSLSVFFLSALLYLLGLISSTTPVSAVDCSNPQERIGTVTFINLETRVLAVDGLLFATDAQTRIENSLEQVIPFDALQPQNSVRVRFCPPPINTTGGVVLPIATRIRQLSSPPPCEARAEGPITGVDQHPQAAPGLRSLTIQGQLVLVEPTTLLVNESNQSIPFDAFLPGLVAEAQGCRVNETTIAARKVVLHVGGNDNGTIVEFHGLIAAKNEEAKSFVIAGKLVLTNLNTQFVDEDGAPLTFNSFSVGNAVEVRGAVLPSGAVLAGRIKLEDVSPPPPPPDGTFRICGYLFLVNDDGSVVVAGELITTNEATIVLDREGAEIALEDLVPGDFVCAEGVRQEGGVRLATKIKKEDRIEITLELRGFITQITDLTFRINDVVVRTVAETQYRDKEGNEIARGDFAVGDFVEAYAVHRDGEGLVARKIQKEDAPSPPEECEGPVELTGAIENLSLEGKILTVSGRLVRVGEQTRFRNELSLPIPFGALAVGDNVKVRGFENEDGSIAACIIRKLAQDGPGGPDDTIRLYGAVNSVNAEARSFVVRDTTVVTNNLTEYRKRHGELVSFEDVTAGSRVVVRGNRLENGTFLARVVHIINENDDPIERRLIHRRGFVTALDLPTSFTVNRQSFLIDGPVQVFGLGGIPLTLENLAVGDFVNVGAIPRFPPPESLVPPQPPQLIAKVVVVRGAVVSDIDATSKTLTVAGYNILTNNETEIVRQNVGPIAFEDLTVGDLVSLRGELVDDETFLARRILVLVPPIIGPPVPPFDPPDGDTDDGKPVICARNNVNTFGFISLPEDAFGSAPNTLFEVIAKVSTNTPDRTRVPQLRLRANNKSLQKGSLLVVNSLADGRYSPTPDGYTYRMLFMPALTPEQAAENDDWFFSLDLLNFDPSDDPNGCVRLESLDTNGIDSSRIRVAETLLDQSFDASSEGWNSGSAPEAFSTPVAESGHNGSLDLSPADRNTFGFWTFDTGVEVQGGAIYRGRFLIRSSSADQSQVPTIRVRLNLKSFTLGSLSVVESAGSADESPDAQGKVYDAYLFVPEPPIDGDTIRASFDVLNFSDDDVDSPVSLDHFTLERIEIDP